MASTAPVDPPRHRRRIASAPPLIVALALTAGAGPAAAQLERLPDQGGLIQSLGQPPRVQWLAGATAGLFLDRMPERHLGLQVFFGATHPVLNPVAGIANIGVEGYVGARDAVADGGGRVMLRIPYVLTGVGLEYSIRDGAASPLLSIYGPIRRGGIVVPGGLIRADVYPRRRGFALGVTVPVGDRFAGRGRPLKEHVVVAGLRDRRIRYHPDRPDLDVAFDSLRVSADWIRRLIAPYLDHDGRNHRIALGRTRAYVQALRDRLRVRSSEAEVRYFHRQLDSAFVLAAGGDAVTGVALARQARRTVLDEMLLPYDRLLGRKKRNDTLRDLAVAARGRYSKWLAASGPVPAARIEDVLYVFQRYTDLLDDVRHTASHEWNDKRLIWLPLQYALRPEEHDEQTELDSLLARATDLPLTTGNRVRYIANLQFHHELLRTIHETRDYHVLWIHDFPAVTPKKALDWASYEQIVDGYLAALADRVEEYDRTGKLPSFFIFLDQFYYESRRSHILMDIVEDPLSASSDLPGGVHGDRARLERVLARLRAAVAGSRVLQAETREYGDGWLHNRIKVQVNVTNRADPSFFSGALVGTVFGYPDNVMRDHRKIVFRDVREDNPEEGEAILTGTGVGQQYLGPGWVDRALMIEGPVLLELRRAASDLLLSQGMPERELPPELRPAQRPAPAARPGDGADERLSSSALLLVNGTGYLPKPINVAKAILYTLMPPGSVIKIPDSLWNSEFFGALVVGAALRGVTVSVTAPALSNAPSAGPPQMARAHELLSRLLVARQELGPAIQAAGGELRVGLYALDPDEGGFASRAGEWIRNVSQGQPTRAFRPVTSDVVAAVAAAMAPPDSARPLRTLSAPMPPPKLHHKVQYLATGDLWNSISEGSEWTQFVSAYMRYRQATYTPGDARSDTLAQALSVELTHIAQRLFGEAEVMPRGASYALVGSQNMDCRGMFMDGEVSLLFGGAESLVPLVDLLFLEGLVTWIDDQQTLDRLLPPPGEFMRRLARMTKDFM